MGDRLNKKRERLLKLLKEAEDKWKEFEINRCSGDFYSQIKKKKVIKYPREYLKHGIFSLLKYPVLIKGRVFWGEKFFTHLPEGRSISLFHTLGGCEIRLTKFFIKNFREDSVFFDVGANYGFYSLLAKQFIDQGEIHAFEPSPNTFQILQKNLSGKDNIFFKSNRTF